MRQVEQPTIETSMVSGPPTQTKDAWVQRLFSFNWTALCVACHFQPPLNYRAAVDPRPSGYSTPTGYRMLHNRSLGSAPRENYTLNQIITKLEVAAYTLKSNPLKKIITALMSRELSKKPTRGSTASFFLF